MKTRVIKCRVDEKTGARWDAYVAAHEGATLSDLIRTAVDHHVRKPSGPVFAPPAPDGRGAKYELRDLLARASVPTARRTPCRHGVAPWGRCLTCDGHA